MVARVRVRETGTVCLFHLRGEKKTSYLLSKEIHTLTLLCLYHFGILVLCYLEQGHLWQIYESIFLLSLPPSFPSFFLPFLPFFFFSLAVGREIELRTLCCAC
jgi:hypothetical protein